MVQEKSLVETLHEAGIRLKAYHHGKTEHIRCPKCDGGRTKEPSFSVTIDLDDLGFTAMCHRGSCGHRVGKRINSGPKTFVPPRPNEYRKPQPHDAQTTTQLPEWLFQFFFERRIGNKTIQTLGIYATTRKFPDPVGDSPCIVFPYRFGGEVVNRKYRPFPAKNPMLQEKDALPTLYNIDRVGETPEEMIFVEGEMDVAALLECGLTNAVTLKDGAPDKVQAETDPDAKRFAALKTHAEILTGVKRIILAGDADAPGLALREELARRLGRHRCRIVTWPERCKDAGDTLREYGPDAVTDAIARAEPYPIDGLQRVKPGTLLALRRGKPPEVMTTGTMATDAALKLPTEGRLIIVTGFPGAGKTNWVRFVMVHTAEKCDRRWAVFSPEMQPWEQFAAECAQVWAGKPFWWGDGVGMTDDEITTAENWLGDRMTLLVCDAEDVTPTVDWILERARLAVLRDGATDVVIDPWNEVDQDRPMGMNETEFVGRALQRFKAFGLRHGCNVWIIAHPAKPTPQKGETKGSMPGPYDIAGSAHWFNRADVGITVHSTADGIADIHIWKTRFQRWGTRGKTVRLAFDKTIGRYSTPVPELSAVAPSKMWNETDD